MSKPPPKPVTTAGDSKVHLVGTLGDLGLVTSQLSSAIDHLHDFVSENISDGTQKKIIMKQIKLIAKASCYTKTLIDDVKHYSGVVAITSRDESRKRAASNLNNKVESKFKKSRKIFFIHVDDNILATLVGKIQLVLFLRRL